MPGIYPTIIPGIYYFYANSNKNVLTATIIWGNGFTVRTWKSIRLYNNYIKNCHKQMTLYDQTVHNYVFSVIIMYGFRLLYDFFMTFLYINSCQL